MNDPVRRAALYGGKQRWEVVAPGTGTTDPLDVAKAAKRALISLSDHLSGRRDEINTDPALTPLGKRQQLAELIANSQNNLKSIRDQHGRVEQARKQVLAQDRSKPVEISELIRQLFQIQKDTEHLPKDALETKVVYLSALDAGNHDVMNAIETMSGLDSGSLDQEDLAELKGRRMLVQDPSRSVELQILDEAASEITNILNDVETEFFGKDDLATAAAAEVD